MDPGSQKPRLSDISTLWSVVCRAHRGPAEAVSVAQQLLLERYGAAVRRHLTAAVRRPDVADELFQEFALRLVKGGLGGADPRRGRFRDFVQGVLFHLVADYHKRQRKEPLPLTADVPEPAVEPPSLSQADEAFVNSWREELLARSWAALAAAEGQTGQRFYTVLHLRAEQPGLSSARLAEEVSARLGRPCTAAGVRQTLHRAREKFADLLLDEVAQSLEDPTPEQVEEELLELGLLDYCRPRLGRRSPGG
jgi:RNA polymerase sigma-70 factor (ECF subfamily)